MPDTLRSILQRATEVASQLDDPHAVELIAAIRNQTRTSKLQILLVGSTGSGRFSIAGTVLGQPDLLPVSPIPKAPLSLTVRHGASVTAEIVASDGSRTAFQPERLRSFLTGPAWDAQPEGARYVGVEMTSSSDVLRTSELRVEALEARRSAAEWKELLAGTDYVILVLNAAALLSEQERRFVRDLLVPSFGLERVAIVVNQMDLVPEDERASIVELVRTYLGPFESQPALVELSVVQARRALAGGERPSGAGYEALMYLVREDLVERHGGLREMAARQAAEICVSELEEAVARQRALISMSDADLRNLKDGVDAREEWLQGRVRRTQQKIDIFISTLIKEEVFREIESFGNLFRRRISDEVMAVGDVSTIRRHLPGYIETVWSDFLNYQMVIVRSRLLDEIAIIGGTVEEDLKELLAGTDVEVNDLLVELEPTSTRVHSFVMPSRGKHYASGVVRGLSLTGLVVLVFNLPFGLATLGAGYVVRTIFRRGIAESEKEAIAASAAGATRDLELQIKRQIQPMFDELTVKLKDEIARLYEVGITRIKEALEESISRRGELEEQRSHVERAMSETIPELRRALEGAARQEVPA